MSTHIDSTEGYVEYKRKRYRCSKCEKYFYPADMLLGLNKKTSMTPQKQNILIYLAVRLTYSESQDVYSKITGMSVSRTNLWKILNSKGTDIANQHENVLLESMPSPPSEKDNYKTHVGTDGVMVHIRKQGWKEAKVGVAYQRLEDDSIANVKYTATLDARETIGIPLFRLAGAPSKKQSKHLAVIGDAASWIDDIKSTQFPNATRIVDLFHTLDYVASLSRTWYPNDINNEWFNKKKALIKQGKINDVIKALKLMKPWDETSTEYHNNAIRYLSNHKQHMQYNSYKELGFHCGSGVVEATCKNLVQTRLKRTGMRWSRNGAETMLKLRSIVLNEQFDLACKLAA